MPTLNSTQYISKFFAAVKEGPDTIGDGKLWDLLDWLQRYVNLVAPNNGIEYWDYDQVNNRDLPSAVGYDPERKNIDHAIAYAYRGKSEGAHVSIGFGLADGSVAHIARIKTFGSDEENWKIAQSMQDALTAIFCFKQIPRLVEFADLVPINNFGSMSCPKADRSPRIELEITPCSLTVNADGNALFTQAFIEHHGYFCLRECMALAKDWEVVFHSLEANFRITRKDAYSIPNLPGYEVLSEGTDANDCSTLRIARASQDDQHLGPFKRPADAVEYANKHHASQQANSSANTHRPQLRMRA